LFVTIAKGQKLLGNKKITPDTITKPEIEDMSRKTRTYGNPNLFTKGKKTQTKRQHKHRYKFGGANALPIFFYLTIVFFVVGCTATNK